MIPGLLFRILLTVVMFCSVYGCQGEGQPPMSERSEQNGPDQELWGSTIILSVRGQTRAKVWAQHILKFEEKHIVQMDGKVKVDFYNEQGTHVSVLTAQGGDVDESSQDLQARGNVVVISDEGACLETERLRWHNATQKIVSDTLVTITRDDETVMGIGFESDADLEHWEMKENVTGVVKRRDAPKE
jgi:LPS export ABC transporter protein LptC